MWKGVGSVEERVHVDVCLTGRSVEVLSVLTGIWRIAGVCQDDEYRLV